ncbi:hypothetical protein CLV24_10465 [Pontibacter ummariensis]|uniref:DUF5666 domain-containing protein n=1 Tax=Pontibacter ummariensis TaxID=1610492 RepID=A0A239D6K5_9BACT|nr:hypothetical protein [Pontibacter ummariensis]PRY14255.1 hypothetical protein CLV24_10465 [Pontibacter ummariensis]SNS27494.1 hypothetical protein SAMN06296052_10464 [Pontibacter ummariensis]
MKNLKPLALLMLFLIPFLYSCQEETDVVESGVYEGTIAEVEADKSEIYVETAEGQLLELYFTDNTVLTRNGEEVAFDQLAEGGRVEVEVEKVGQRLDPIAVRILE